MYVKLCYDLDLFSAQNDQISPIKLSKITFFQFPSLAQLHPELLGAGLRGLDAGGADVRLPLRRSPPVRRARLARTLGK